MTEALIAPVGKPMSSFPVPDTLHCDACYRHRLHRSPSFNPEGSTALYVYCSALVPKFMRPFRLSGAGLTILLSKSAASVGRGCLRASTSVITTGTIALRGQDKPCRLRRKTATVLRHQSKRPGLEPPPNHLSYLTNRHELII